MDVKNVFKLDIMSASRINFTRSSLRSAAIDATRKLIRKSQIQKPKAKLEYIAF